MPTEHSVARFLIPALLLAALAGCATAPAVAPAERPATWATRLDVPELENLYRVTPDFYRSAQPEEYGLVKAREQLGVRTVINLNAFHSDVNIAHRTGLDLEEVDMHAWHIYDEDVVYVLRTLRQRERGPFLLHCRHGADRTGLITAMYRVVEQGWTKEQALDEMQHGDYGFHPVWKNLVRYVQNVDVEKIRARVLAPATTATAETAQ